MIRSRDVNPATGNKWYEDCETCNYHDHRCPFCGEYLSHDGYDPKGNLHDTTLGDLAELMEEWKHSGISRESVEYVIERVWWE